MIRLNISTINGKFTNNRSPQVNTQHWRKQGRYRFNIPIRTRLMSRTDVRELGHRSWFPFAACSDLAPALFAQAKTACGRFHRPRPFGAVPTKRQHHRRPRRDYRIRKHRKRTSPTLRAKPSIHSRLAMGNKYRMRCYHAGTVRTAASTSAARPRADAYLRTYAHRTQPSLHYCPRASPCIPKYVNPRLLGLHHPRPPRSVGGRTRHNEPSFVSAVCMLRYSTCTFLAVFSCRS